MKSLTSIVAVNREGAIGCQNALPWRLKSDLAFFRNTTSHNVVILGRKTYDSIGKCLPNRTNLVLSHNAVLFQSTPECQVVCSIDEALVSASRYRSKSTFVIGGASTYAQFAPLVDRYLITVVDKHVEDADAFLSEAIFGDEANWEKRVLGEYPAILGVDEAPFAIYEWVAIDQAHRASMRNDIIERHKQRNHMIRSSVHPPSAPSRLQSAEPLTLQL